jgi:ERCC4-type nuclease
MSDASSHESRQHSTASINDVCRTCGSIVTIGRAAKSYKRHKTSPSKPRKRRKTMALLEKKAVRKEVKTDMLAAIPGITPAKATAILEACEGSFAHLVGASSTEIARAVYLGAPLGPDVGVAVWRALH